VTEQTDHPGGERSVIPPDIHPREPAFVRSNTAAAPIALTLVHSMVVYFPDFFRPGFLFGVIVFPPFTAFSWGIYVWARGKKLTGDQEADARTIVDTTTAYLAFQVIGTPILSMVLFLWALHGLVWGAVVGSLGYVLLVLAYVAILAASVFFFPEWHVRLEADSLKSKPRTVLGRLLSPQLRVPRPAAVAGPALLLTVLLRGVLSNAWQATIFACMGLALALYLVVPSTTALHRFRRLWRIRKELSTVAK
jgi:hypothetical protein